MTAKDIFIHHVYFWLNNPESKEDLRQLLEGLQKLSKVTSLKMFHIGKPADTNRDVVENSYAVSWMLVFGSKEDEEGYQVDPLHLEFVAACKHLWKRVVVYDSIDA
ncbi:MAG: Dabb family protein [Flavitalea sp.]